MTNQKLFTIGFTKTSAKHFFGRLSSVRVRHVLDVRLHNSSQLAGFAKRGDLEYFLRAIAQIEYSEVPELAPSPELLDGYRKCQVTWHEYAARYVELLEHRAVDSKLQRQLFVGACLLCSEDKPERCHRRLAAEFLASRWGDLEIVHL